MKTLLPYFLLVILTVSCQLRSNEMFENGLCNRENRLFNFVAYMKNSRERKG